jgi:hypothetical protein
MIWKDCIIEGMVDLLASVDFVVNGYATEINYCAQRTKEEKDIFPKA